MKINRDDLCSKTVSWIIVNHNKMNERFNPLKGMRVKTCDEILWEYSSCNDLGIPYFKKVVNGKTQKTEYTVVDFKREWAEKELNNLIENRAIYKEVI